MADTIEDLRFRCTDCKSTFQDARRLVLFRELGCPVCGNTLFERADPEEAV